MRILIVENNDLTARVLRHLLRKSYAVDIAQTGQDGLLKAQATDYDLLLLDLNLPDMSGETVCSILRRSGIKTPILVLSGRNRVEDKVALLDTGADDYLTKPFSDEELQARIRAVIRRGETSGSSGTLKVRDVWLDPAARTVKYKGQDVALRRKEFDLLEYLMRNSGRTLSRGQIIEHIWDDGQDLWANVVDVHIKHLRDKIDRPFGQNMIRTVHGIGYKLETVNK